MSSKKAIATRNPNDDPICGECKSIVNENAKTCVGCGADLYTRKGMFVRRSIGGVGGLMAFLGIGMLLQGGGAVLGGIILLAIGLLPLYIWYQMVKTAPNRELRLRQHIPF